MIFVRSSVSAAFLALICVFFNVGCPKDYRLSDVCGNVKAVDRIIGGDVASMGQFPWMARLGYVDPDTGDQTFRCGGSLVGPQHVLTAAHCTYGDLARIIKFVRLGEHDAKRNPDCNDGVCAPKVQDIHVKKVYTHKKYNLDTQQHDIALLKLTHPAILHEYVTPVCLPTDMVNSKDFYKKRVVAAGWGLINSTTEEVAQVLRYVSLPVEKPDLCADTFTLSFYPTQICIGSGKGKDTCVGDSGGPIMTPVADEKGPARFYQLGIVSYGARSCGFDAAVYTNVSHYTKWIYDLIRQ